MPNFIYENAALAPVKDFVLRYKQKYFVESCQYMVLEPIIVAEILNHLPTFYCTSVRGKVFQLRNLANLQPSWEETARKIFWQSVNHYSHYRERERGEIQFLNPIVNASELFIDDKFDYLLERDFSQCSQWIDRNQVVAKILSGMQQKYVATPKDLNRVKLELSRTRILNVNTVRQAINLVLSRPLLDTALDDGNPTKPISKTSKIKKTYSLKLHFATPTWNSSL